MDAVGIRELNTLMFLKWNAGPNPAYWLEFLARTASMLPLIIAAMILVGLWIWGTPSRRGPLLAVLAGLIVAFLLTAPFALWHTPRPFELGIGHTLIAHSPDTSFPSHHVLVIWSVAFGLLTTGAGQCWGWTLVFLGFATAWARVYLGVHFPFDMAGSLVISLLSAAAARGLLVLVERRFLPPVELLYKTLLRHFNLPPTVFPR